MTPQSSPPADDHSNGHGTPAPASKPSFYRRYALYLWIGGALALVLVAFAFYLRIATREPFSGLTYTVKKEVLRVTIVERGNLESAENSDIVCRIQARTKGSTIASTIKWVIDDGTFVKAGDRIVELDDSGFLEQLKTQKNTVNKAYSDYIQASNETTIQDSKNVSDIKTAEVNLIQARIELKKYAGEIAGAKLVKLETYDQIGDYLRNGFEADVKKESDLADGKYTSAYLQDVSAYEGTIETARSDKDSWMDRASWSQRMVKKGFYSLSQADADQSRLDSMKIALRKAEGDLDIYRFFEREKHVTKKWSDVKEAERALNRTEKVAVSMMKQKRADEDAKKAIYDQEDERLRDLKNEEKYYRIDAPQDGIIVYHVSEQSRFGSGSQQSTIAQGEPVREGQKLIRIPNLAKMVVNTRIHEAMFSKIRPEDTRPTGYSDRMRNFFAIGRHDLLALASYQMAFEAFRDTNPEIEDEDGEVFSLRKKDFVVRFPGHAAKIRVEAFSGRIYEGHVKSVATMAAQGDWMSSDVKLYNSMVSIDDLEPSNQKLKPGMSAEVTILADESKEAVLAIPIQAVVGNVAMGAERKCFVLDAAGYPQERDIKLGKSNDQIVEIVTGVSEGDKVVLNPRALLPEKSDMKPGTPGTRRGAEFQDGAGKKTGKKGDGGGKGKGAQPGGPPQEPGRDGKAIQLRSDGPPPAVQDRTFKKS